MLRIRIRDPGLGAFLTPGSGIRDGRKSASGSGILDEQPRSYFLELRNQFFCFFVVKIHKFFDEDPGSGMETVRIRDPGWKKVGSGIRDKHPGSATLEPNNLRKVLSLSDCEKFLVTYFMLLLRPPAMASLSEVLTSSRAFSLQKTMCLIPLQPLTQDYHELFSFSSFYFWLNNRDKWAFENVNRE